MPNTLHLTRPHLGIVGQQAPAWSVSEWRQLPVGVTTLNVDDFRGKVLYLYFFQSWCPGCHSSGFPTLQKLQQQFTNSSDVAFVVIQTTFEGHDQNGVDKLLPTAGRYGLKIPFGQSAGNSGTPDIMYKYRTGGTPWVVLIDKQGKVVFNDFHIDPAGAAEAIRQLKTR
ncbi:TlpA family protein disulfide reductase [Thalassoglobus sp.]|uniref:TlpA family protein disulfide reductase n=1 Tax=Thalassoglobus sp. TaxID=2795869 RepID=UPI003AA80D88